MEASVTCEILLLDVFGREFEGVEVVVDCGFGEAVQRYVVVVVAVDTGEGDGCGWCEVRDDEVFDLVGEGGESCFLDHTWRGFPWLWVSNDEDDWPLMR